MSGHGEGWVIDFSAFVLATGNCKQLYPEWATVGIDPASATTGQLIRRPGPGSVSSLQILTNAVNGGTLEVWDYAADQDGIDVSSTDVISNAEIAAAVAAGNAKRIHKQNFLATSETPLNIGPFNFSKGLVARVSNGTATGTCSLNMKVSGGVRKTTKI